MTTAQHTGTLAGRRGLTLGDYLIPSSLATRAPAWARDVALIAGGVILLIIGARIAFELPAAGHARLDVYDLGGRRIATLLDESLPAGRHAAAWNGRDDAGAVQPGGVYLFRLETRHQGLPQATSTKGILLK